VLCGTVLTSPVLTRDMYNYPHAQVNTFHPSSVKPKLTNTSVSEFIALGIVQTVAVYIG
jgi:hypothetical protein